MEKKKEQRTEIKIPPGVKGIYANLMLVSHTGEEFCLDFVTRYPDHCEVAARIFISPGHLKRVIGALQDNMKKYEKKLGKEVQPAEEPKIGFR